MSNVDKNTNSNQQKSKPIYKIEVIKAMEEARKLSKDSKTKRYPNFSEVLKEING